MDSVGLESGELFFKSERFKSERVQNKSAKRSVVVSLNFILFADPRGVWIPGSLGCKVPLLWESWLDEGMIREPAGEVLNRDGLF